MASEKLVGRLGTAEAIREYMLAGNATFTLRNVRTGNRFTYKIKEAKEGLRGNPPPWFVALLTGPDNVSNYQCLGTIFPPTADAAATLGMGEYRHNVRKSRIREDAPSARVFREFYKMLSEGTMPKGLEVWHEGSCGRCGRTLTVPESVERGIGPECIKHMEIEGIDTDDLLADLI